MTRPGRIPTPWTSYLLPLLLYGALTAVMTFPLVVYLGKRIIGEPYDATMFVWNMWWFKHALFDLHTHPFYTDYIFHPEGVNLYLHTLCLFKVFLSIPFQYLFSIIVTYNLLVFITFVATGFTGYLLGRYLIRDLFGAFICGVIFAFSTFRLVHTLGHLNLISTEWIPLFVLFLIKFLRRPTWSSALLTGLFFLFVALSSWYLATGCVILGVVVVAWYLARGKVRWRHIGYLAVTVALTGVLLMPLLVPMLRILMSGEQPVVGMTAQDQVNYSMDLVSPFIFSPGHFLFGRIVKDVYNGMPGLGMEHDSYIGIVALVLSLITVLRMRKLAWLWVWCGAFFFILALGPYLSVFGRWQVPFIHAIPLPYLALRNIPIFSAARIPSRFIVFVILALAVLAGYGVKYVLHWHPIFSQRRYRFWCVSALTLLICAENAILPYPMARIGISEFYQNIASEPANYSILDLPFEPGFSFYHYYQIYHRKKIIYGHIARTPYQLLRDKQERFYVSKYYVPDRPEKNLEFLRRFIHGMQQAGGGKYIVIHKEVTTPQQMALLRAFLTDAKLWGQTDHPQPPGQYFKDQYLIVYQFTP